MSRSAIKGGHGPGGHGRGMEADRLQFPVLPGGAAIDPEKRHRSRRYWTLTFPLLSPTTFFLLVVNIVYVFFDTFGIIDAVTEGGPAGATTTMVYKVYADGRLGGDLGSSAAQSVVLMVIVIALTAVQFRYVERKVQY